MKKLICFLMVAVLLLSVIPQSAIVRVEAASTLSLQQLREKFPHGKYWNHANNPGGSNSVNNQNGYTSTPCTRHGGYIGTSYQTCNGFQPGGSQLSWQCMGFAEKLGYDATGYNPRNNANGWVTYTSSSALNNLKPGDIVRYKNNGHSIYVIAVNGDTVTYADCNSDNHCIIRWDATISKATLRSSFTHVRSAPSAITPSTSCSCSTSYAGTYICTTSSANLTIRSGHGSSYSAIGSIPSGASVTVSKASGTGSGDWAHVTYNGVSGYSSMQYLQKAGEELDVRISYWVSHDKMGDAISSAMQGDWVYLCYRLYDKNSGKNLNEIKRYDFSVKETIYNPDGSVVHSYTYEDSDNNWIGGGCYKPGTYTCKVELTGDWVGTYTTTFTVAENPKQIHASTSSVSLTLGSSETSTIYVWTSGYHSSAALLRKAESNNNISTSWGEWNDDDKLPLTITANKAGTTTLTLTVEDKATGAVLDTITVNVTVTSNTHTITYNANGGSGAPSSTVKNHGQSATISTTLPTRQNYTFKGWATSSSSSTVAYKPGDIYSSNSSITLYAVWESATVITSSLTSSEYSASVDFAGGYKYFSFTPSQSGKYVFESTGDKDTIIAVYSSSGTEITSNDDGGDNRNFKLSYQFNAGTTYIIKVKLYSSNTGSFSFTGKRIYTVSYNLNGGTASGGISSQEKIHGSSVTLSSTVPTKDNHTFKGWATSSSSSTVAYKPGDIYSSNSSITLYAVWESATVITSSLTSSEYSASVDFAGGYKYFSFTPSQSGKYVFESTGDKDTIIAVYSSSGTEITSNDDGGDNRNFKLSYQFNAGTTYIIKVKLYSSNTGSFSFTGKRIYTVSYNLNGGTASGGISSQEKIHGSSVTLSSTVPTKDNHTFKGWATSSSSSTAAYTAGATYSANSDVTLYAVWEQNAAITVTGISVERLPSKTSYITGESLDTSGLTIKVRYSNNTTETVTTGFTVSGFSSATAGTKTVTVSYSGKTTTFSVTVNAPSLPPQDTDGARYELLGAKGVAGGYVDIYLSIADNPSIISLRASISYDEEALELVSVTDAGLLNGWTAPSSNKTSPYVIRWMDALATSGNSSNGNIAVLRFKILDGVQEGEYTVSVSHVEARNVAGQKITFEGATGTVTVGNDTLIGDVDGDGEISDFDSILLEKMLAGHRVSINAEAADCDGDGEVSDFDAILLARYLCGWSVELG